MIFIVRETALSRESNQHPITLIWVPVSCRRQAKKVVSMSASISESVIGCLTTLYIRRMDDQAHVKKKNLTCLQHPTVTEGGEAIEAPIVPGSEMLALMLTAF